MKKVYFALTDPNRILLIIVAAGLILGLAIADDFGASWDDFIRYEKGQASLRKYVNLDIFPDGISSGLADSDNNGSVFDMAAALSVGILHSIYQQIELISVLHFVYFLSFLLGIICLYFISKRFMRDWAALATTIFFGSQPLLFGHAFINPKDIPFMSLFMAVILTGMIMVEDLIVKSTDEQDEASRAANLKSNSLHSIYEASSNRKRLFGENLYALIISWLIILSIYIFGRQSIYELISTSVEKVYSAGSSTFMGRLFLQFAEHANSIPVEAYQDRAITFANQLFLSVLALSFLFILFLLVPQRISDFFGSILRGVVRTVSPYVNEINRQLPRKIFASLTNRNVLLAGIMLGLSTSVRILGPAAGALVVFYYFFSDAKKKSIAPILAYFSLGAVVTYLTWPYMWGRVIQNTAESLNKLIGFRPQEVFFNGAYYPATELPASYFPTFLAFQFTEPLLLLSLAGIFWVMIRWRMGTLEGNKVTLLFLWFFLPAVIIVVVQPNMYNTIRHVLFIIPPLFIFAGIIFDLALQKIRRRWIPLVLFVGVIFPGVVAIQRLHPYEYIYFNQYVGGVQGAFRKYNLDYWGTSFREVINYVNETAEQDATVYIYGPPSASKYYLREDITLSRLQSIEISQAQKSDSYVLILTKNYYDLYDSLETIDVFTVKREGTVLAVVRKLK